MDIDFEKIHEKLNEMYGDKIVDSEVFPMQFKRQVQMALRAVMMESEGVPETVVE